MTFFSYVVMNLFFALAFIVLVHHTWEYVRDTYTPKKTKNLVDYQVQKYKDMFYTIQQQVTAPPPSPSPSSNVPRLPAILNDTIDGPFRPIDEKNQMINDLYIFLGQIPI